MRNLCFWAPACAGIAFYAQPAPSQAADQILAIDSADVIYTTGFEASEGFDPGYTLIGQGGWVGEGSGGNGFVDGFFEGLGQHAFVGFAPPEGPEPEVVLSVWPPANWAPTDLENSVVRFSVLMRIVDSTTEDRDDFRWSAYNSDAQRLFTIDFDNLEQSVNYALDDGEFVSTGLGFDNQGFYELVVHMNFVRNLWSATLNGIVIANSLEITTTGAALNLGDVDAVWAIRSPERPGDNFLVFDNYLIAIASTGSIPPVLESLNMVNGNYQFRLYGEEDLDYRIEVSNDLREWFTLGTFTAPAGGIFDFEDTTAPEYRTGFYRVRQVD